MGITETVKNIGGLLIKVQNAELKADLQQCILDLQGECLELQERNHNLLGECQSLKAEMKKLEDTAELRKQIKIGDTGGYNFTDEQGTRRICSACFETKHKAIPLNEWSYSWDCPVCKATYASEMFDCNQ